MAYLYNIPLSTDQLSVSQGNILGNFTALGAIAGNANPSSYSLNNIAGFNWLYLPTNGAIPPAASAFAAGNIGLYSATSPVTGQNELYINKTDQATVVQVQSTASILSTNSAPPLLTAGWTYLPSGILLKWAANQAAAGGLQMFNFPVAGNIPAFTTCMTVIVQVADSGAGDINRAIILKGVAPTNFTIYASNRTTTGAAACNFTYLAIGY